MVDHHLPAESDHEVADANGELSCRLHNYIPIDAKNTANSPSSTITRKIDSPPSRGLSAERLGAALDAEPLAAGDDAIRRAMNGALMMPTSKLVTTPPHAARDEDRRPHIAIELRHQAAAIERRDRADELRIGSAMISATTRGRINTSTDQAPWSQRIDLLAHLHRTEFKRIGTARTAGHHDRHDQDTEFAQHQDADM